MSYASDSAIGIESVGPPSIRLSSGDVIKAKGVSGGANEVAGSGIYNRMYHLGSLPAGENTVTLDLASHLSYYESQSSIVFDFGDFLSDISHATVVESESYTLSKQFSLGSAQFEITNFVLKPSEFSIGFRPLNRQAQQTVLSGTYSQVSMQDDQGNHYSSPMAIARWNDA